ncbi:GNAT family N-acetyltransferase [Bordetella sp. 2513F-2]
MPVWSCVHHAELRLADLYALLRLRAEVFIMEQQCPYLDPDGKDLQGETRHLMAHDPDGRLVACARLLDPALHGGEVIIGRVITAPQVRGVGLGHELMRQALDHVRRHWPGLPVYLSAQARLQAYYAGHGFVPVTAPYIEDGIPHIGMRRACA